MLDHDKRKMLDENGIGIVNAAYEKQMRVSVLPRDRDIVIQFANGTATFGEADEYIRDYHNGQLRHEQKVFRWTKYGVIIGIAISVGSLAISAVSLCYTLRHG